MDDQKRHTVYLEAKEIYCRDPTIRSEELAWHCNYHVWQEIGIPWNGGQNPTNRRLEADRVRQLAQEASSGVANQFQAVMRQERPPNATVYPVSAPPGTLVRYDTQTSLSVRAPMQPRPQPFPPQREQKPLPPTAPASWRPVNDAPCANCGRTDHKLIICMGPLVNGCIRGCPLHNSKSHNLDECPLPLAHHVAQQAYYLFKARNGRPPLEVKGNLIAMHNGDYFGWPWTPAFAEKNKEFYKTYDYKLHQWGSNNLAGSGSGTSEPVLADPAWVDGSWKKYLSITSGPVYKPPAKRAKEEEVDVPVKKLRKDRKEESSSPPNTVLDTLTIKAAFELQQLIESSQIHKQTGGGGASMIDLTSRSIISAITKHYHDSAPKDLAFPLADKSEIRKRQELVNMGVETALFTTYPSLVEELRLAGLRKDEEIRKERSRVMELEKELQLRELKLKVFTRREEMKAAVVNIKRAEDFGAEHGGGEDKEDEEEEEGEIRFIGTGSESGKLG